MSSASCSVWLTILPPLVSSSQGSILELPHLSPSLRPTELSLSPHGSPPQLPMNDASLPMVHLHAEPPLTPSDSPQMSPKQFGLGLSGRGGFKLELGKFDLGARVFEDEVEGGMMTPRAENRELRQLGL